MDEHTQPQAPQPEKGKKSIRDRVQKTAADLRLFERVLPSAFLIGVLSVLVYYVLFAPPTTFQTPAIVKVTPDETLDTIAIKLQDSNAIRNADTFKIVTRLLGGNRHIQSGSYFFPEPQNMFQIALRLIEGDYELHAVRITIAEGMTARDIGDMLVHKIAPFDEEQFLALAMPKEGRLYPDTY
ncbi:MAG TPA: endolytic transglycosylase MltG, partial [Candidatus Paceibacterota bacterium]